MNASGCYATSENRICSRNCQNRKNLAMITDGFALLQKEPKNIILSSILGVQTYFPRKMPLNGPHEMQQLILGLHTKNTAKKMFKDETTNTLFAHARIEKYRTPCFVVDKNNIVCLSVLRRFEYVVSVPCLYLCVDNKLLRFRSPSSTTQKRAVKLGCFRDDRK